MESRKGMEMSLVVVLIIFLLSFAIIGYVTYKFIDQGEKTVDISVCRTSVELKAKAKLGGIGQLAGVNVPLNCPANYLLIKDKKKANEQIANELYNCYYKFGEGKIDFMNKYSFSNKEIKCFLCSKINFDENVFKNQEINDFGKYFLEEGYAEDMYNIKTEAELIKAGMDSIPTKSPIYILFVADKRGSILENLKKNENIFLSGCLAGEIIGGEIGLALGGAPAIPGAILGCLAGGVIHASALMTDYTSYTYWTDSEDLVKICSGEELKNE